VDTGANLSGGTVDLKLLRDGANVVVPAKGKHAFPRIAVPRTWDPRVPFGLVG
jgi:hypothetical protein